MPRSEIRRQAPRASSINIAPSMEKSTIRSSKSCGKSRSVGRRGLPRRAAVFPCPGLKPVGLTQRVGGHDLDRDENDDEKALVVRQIFFRQVESVLPQHRKQKRKQRDQETPLNAENDRIDTVDRYIYQTDGPQKQKEQTEAHPQLQRPLPDEAEHRQVQRTIRSGEFRKQTGEQRKVMS